MSAAAIFYSQFAVAPTRTSSSARRFVRALRVIGLTLVGAYPEPNARRMIGARRRSLPNREAGS